ncbi:MAG TPA: hypothetical protein VJV79_39350 [Polyangiaceae bacterium]|nr:hypothetical protein [Polyangiaceae bacterium]
MKIPALLYGRAAAVRTRARKFAKKLLMSRDFESFDPGEFLETTTSGGILLMSPEHIVSSQDNFHCYALSLAIFELANIEEVAPVMRQWMLASWSEGWRFAGVVGEITAGQPLDLDRTLLRPFAEAAVRHWPALSAEGDRFGPYINAPESLRKHSCNLWFALANLGIPSSDLRVMPSGGPADYLKRIDEMTVGK